MDETDKVMPGLYAAGEVACVSVHGANRLGTNSLLDIVVFGKVSGQHATEYAQGSEYVPLPDDPEAEVRRQIEQLTEGDGSEIAADLRKSMQEVMFDHVGVFRTEEGMRQALDKIRELKQRFKNVRAGDRGTIWNTDVMEIWELGCLLDVAEVTAKSALERKESRGAHAREDFDERDDEKWMRHTMAFLDEDGVELKYKPVTITRFEPKKRVY